MSNHSEVSVLIHVNGFITMPPNFAHDFGSSRLEALLHVHIAILVDHVNVPP